MPDSKKMKAKKHVVRTPVVAPHHNYGDIQKITGTTGQGRGAVYAGGSGAGEFVQMAEAEGLSERGIVNSEQRIVNSE